MWRKVQTAAITGISLSIILIWCCAFFGIWTDNPELKDNLAETVFLLAGTTGGLTLLAVAIWIFSKEQF